MLWALLVVPVLAAFLFPGLLGAALLRRICGFPPFATVLVAVAVSSAAGYALFWVYFIDEPVGRVISVVLLTATLLVIVLPTPARRLMADTARSRHVVVPVALMFMATLLYNGILFSRSIDTRVELRAQVHLADTVFPPDNVLPFLFADRLYNDTNPRSLLGTWHSSDRPPLQAGITLTQLPAASAFGQDELAYQLLGTVLQCSWIAAIWALCGHARLSRRSTAFAIGMALFSGTFFVNSVFVWPKMLAGSLAVLAYVLLLGDDRPSVASAGLAAGAAALALLAHTGVVFTLVPLAAIVLARRTRPSARAAVACAAVVVVLLAPWSAYKRFYDPPGNLLTKMHLAGVNAHEDPRSFGQALVDAYEAAGPGKTVGNKLANLRTVIGDWPPTDGFSPVELGSLRDQEFFHLVWALGLLNLGWFGLTAWLARRRRQRPDDSGRATLQMVAVAGLSILFWVLVMFGPGSTIVHQGSYATVILLFAALAGVIGAWPPAWSAALGVLQVTWFTFLWGVAVPLDGRTVDVGSAVIALVAGALCIALLVRMALGERPGDSAEQVGHHLAIDSPAECPPDAVVRPSPPRSHRRRDARRGPGRSAPPPVPGPR